MTNLRFAIQDLAHQFEDEANAASDLWTWLPSHHFCAEVHGQFNTHHFQPDMATMMREVTGVLAFLAGYDLGQNRYGCPCDDCEHTEPSRAEVEKFILGKYNRDTGTQDEALEELTG